MVKGDLSEAILLGGRGSPKRGKFMRSKEPLAPGDQGELSFLSFFSGIKKKSSL